MYERVLNRLRWLTTGVEPERKTRPMSYIEAMKFFWDIDAELTAEERQEMIEWGRRNAALNLDLPLNY